MSARRIAPAAGLAPAAAGCRRPCGGLGGPQVFSRLRSLLCVQLTPPVFLPGRWPCRFSRFNPWRLAFNRAARDGCIIARLNASVKRFSQTFSVCAICTVECVLRCADCTVECVTPELSRLGRFAGPGPCGLGLSRMLADGRAAVKTPKTFPPAPLKGGMGNYFCTNLTGCFWRKWQKREHLRRGRRRNFQGSFSSRGGTIGGR